MTYPPCCNSDKKGYFFGPVKYLKFESLNLLLLYMGGQTIYTPDAITGVSPAQVIFGRSLRDFLLVSPGRYHPRVEWRLTAEQRETAHAKRHLKTEEMLSNKCRKLPDLQLYDVVAIQDQTGSTPRRWSKTGTVMEVLGHDAYLIKVDGSSRLTKRNRQFLRRITPYQCDTDELPEQGLSPSIPPYQSPQGPPELVKEGLNKDALLSPPTEECSDDVPMQPGTTSNPFSGTDTNETLSMRNPTDVSYPESVSLEPQVQSQESPSSRITPGVQSRDAPVKHRPRIRERWLVNSKFAKTADSS